MIYINVSLPDGNEVTFHTDRSLVTVGGVKDEFLKKIDRYPKDKLRLFFNHNELSDNQQRLDSFLPHDCQTAQFFMVIALKKPSTNIISIATPLVSRRSTGNGYHIERSSHEHSYSCSHAVQNCSWTSSSDE